MTTTHPVRLAARVVLFDPQDRVLLMRYDDGPPNGSHWATPGGGLEPGESYERAALRELAEETGWSDIELLDEIHRRSHTMEWGGSLVHQHERLYLARTVIPARPITGVDEMHTSDGIAAWRWWTAAELTATSDVIWPAVLPDLVRQHSAATMSIPDLSQQLRDFVAARNWQQFQNPKNLVMALTGEVGELTEIFQWLTPEQSASVMSDPGQAEHVRDEIADVLAYLLRLCDVLAINPAAALAEKMTKNALKHPIP